MHDICNIIKTEKTKKRPPKNNAVKVAPAAKKVKAAVEPKQQTYVFVFKELMIAILMLYCIVSSRPQVEIVNGKIVIKESSLVCAVYTSQLQRSPIFVIFCT